MNKQQEKELFDFLNTLDDKATIYDMTHRFLCFEHNNDRTRKPWIGTEQPMDSASFKSDLVFPYRNLKVPFLTTVGELKRIVKKDRFQEICLRGWEEKETIVEYHCDDGIINIIDMYFASFEELYG